jgi:MYXO-CTERM domain-containing protein
MNRVHLLPIATLLAVAAPAFASDQPGTAATQWREEHTAGTTINGAIDAGHVLATANMTRGAGPLTTINGGCSAAANVSLDADLYCITITDPTNFSAVVAGGTDTCLALFDSAGHGVAFNDNRTDSLTSNGAMLTSLLTASLPAGGTYYLGIGRTNGNTNANIQYTRPLDAAGGLMFPGDPAFQAPNDAVRRAEYGPNSAIAVLTSWEAFAGSSLPFNFNYTITLSGAGYSQLPTPGAAGLLGLGALATLRRRRN